MDLDIKPSLLLEALAPATPTAVRRGLARLVKVAQALSEPEWRAHKGIHPHRIHNHLDPLTGLQIESLEVTEGTRLKAMVQDGTLVLLSLHADQQQAYRKR